MILITDISMKEVKGDWAELSHFGKSGIFATDGVISHESIYGRRIITDDGREICLGLANHVHELLGLPFRVIDTQNRIIDRLNADIAAATRQHSRVEKSVSQLRTDNKKYRNKLSNIVNMTLWQRLKFLFCPERTLKGV